MSSRIEQIIDEIEDYIESCKYQPLSNTKIVVNKDELEDLLSELRRKTPDEIKRYQKINPGYQIMQQAYAQANEVVVIATNQAQEILDNATNDANNIRMGAIQYTDGVLKTLEDIIGHAMDTTKARTENLLSSLQGCYELVNANRVELFPEGQEPEGASREGAQGKVQELQVTEI